MLTEVKIRLEPLAEEYARLGNEIKVLEAKKKELAETMLTAMKPGEMLEGSDFDLRCQEGNNNVSWNDSTALKPAIDKLKLELIARGLMIEKKGNPYVVAYRRKS